MGGGLRLLALTLRKVKLGGAVSMGH